MRVIPHKVTILVYHRHEADDAPDEGSRRWQPVQESLFLGWCPPLPREGDIVTCQLGGEYRSGSVRFISHEYKPDGVVFAVYVAV
jgi:hypothetical protein